MEAGEYVGTSSLLFVVIDESQVVAEAGLSERVVGERAQGHDDGDRGPRPTGSLAGGPETGATGKGQLSGVVDSVSPAADPRSMLYEVRLLVPNRDGRLRGGMLARLRVPLETRRGALLVPERATFSENGADYVLVVTPAPAPAAGEQEPRAPPARPCARSAA